eukprot:s834_g3.t2
MRDRLLVSVAAVSRTTDFVVDPRAQMIHRMQIRPSLNSLEHGLLGLGRNRHEALVSAVGQGFHGMFRRLRRGIATTARKRRLQRRREMPVAAKRHLAPTEIGASSLQCPACSSTRDRMNFGWSESETPRGLSRLFSRRKPSQGHSGRTPLATLAPSPSFFGGRRRRTSSVEDGLELDEISDATQRGRPRRRKNLSCLGIFACGASTLPRSGSADAEASPEQAMAAMAITPAPAPRRGAWSGALPDRKPRGSLVEQLGFKSRVFRCSSAGAGSLCTTSKRRTTARRETRAETLATQTDQRSRLIPFNTGTDLRPPSSDDILQELERCRMRLEDVRMPSPAATPLQSRPSSSMPAEDAPSPEQLPSPAALRLRTPGASPSATLPRPRSEKARLRPRREDASLQLAIETANAAFHSTWTTSTPSTRASPGVSLGQASSTWSDTSSPFGETSPWGLEGRGTRRRAATADARCSGEELMEEARALLSEMLSVTGHSMCTSASQTQAYDSRRRHDSAPPVARPPNLIWSSPPSRTCQRAQSASTLGATPKRASSEAPSSFLRPLNGSMPWCPKIEFERPCALRRQKKSQALRSASASCSRLAPLAEDMWAGPPPGASRSCSEGPQGAVLARSLVIPEEGRPLRLEPSDADDEFCKLLTAALAAPTESEGYGLEASPPPTPAPTAPPTPPARPAPPTLPAPACPGVAEAKPDSDGTQERETREVTMPLELRQPQSRPQLTLLPLPGCAKTAAEPPQRSPSCHPFGAKPSSEVTPRSMSCETREEFTDLMTLQLWMELWYCLCAWLVCLFCLGDLAQDPEAEDGKAPGLRAGDERAPPAAGGSQCRHGAVCKERDGLAALWQRSRPKGGRY